MNHKTIAVDFDGTLFANAYPDIGEPMWNVINWCKEQQLMGNKLILWTCREGYDLDNAIEACKLVGLTFDAINCNIIHNIEHFENDCRKVCADIYIDDRAVTPHSLCTLQNNS